ncbi:MOSC domain-containing protein YiiM [Scopulibacillus darangshiensis]|uniref:MOSC domain-containing protein YiiM n=1 Tax=Scopulibacillus darangshiensis TaxID=442528 RepID=A0A4R2P4S5_9BACL|nr:MOSC domain-containing protein [Scopulibacillus darangshiensis]TCP29820.1 MOSC domain-containing protein YiiM [Scopulibacillus darangshiensis]
MRNYPVLAISVGKPQQVSFQRTSVETAIYKTNVIRPVYLSKTNLDGDVQADQKNHGGPDKALCAHCFKRYPYWEERLGKTLDLGTFGENLTIDNLIEEEAYIGDTFQFGEAIIQISQPRRPCFKLGVKMAEPTLAAQFQETGYTGFYFRVLKTGIVNLDNPLQFISRPEFTMSISELNRITYSNPKDCTGLETALSIDELAESWRRGLEKKLGV